MNQSVGVILCLSYILGLLVTVVPWGGLVIIALGAGLSFAAPGLLRKFNRSFQKKPNQKDNQESIDNPILLFLTFPKWLWLMAGIVGFLASIYLQVRSPQPAADDISKLIAANGNNEEIVVTVRGEIASTPRLTRSGKSQFWLETVEVSEINGSKGAAEVNRRVSGQLYVTVPLLQTTGLYSGDAIEVTGTLYKPQPPSNPGAFDFRSYLAREGAFAGFKGRQLNPIPQTPNKWGWWALRLRIVRSQVLALGIPEGPLVSAIALGKQAVDLPYDIRDDFVQVGLAHAIAASGTQVSMVLALVISLTRRFSPKIQFTCGVSSLLLLIGLTGLEPSVSRAALMGFGTLFALVMQSKVKPLGLLLLAATILLLFNPLWIWDLGFQLSFLATLGLLVTSPTLSKWLDWLPPTISSIIAVPIAASVWVLPLQLYVFNVISPYCILVNIITAPLLWIVSIGGMISALGALILPTAGSAIASLLHYPAQGLIQLAEYFSQLPGNSVAVGSLSELQLIALYGIICLVWFWGIWQEGRRKREEGRRKKEKGKKKKAVSSELPIINYFSWLILPLAIAAFIGIIVIPAWQTQANLFQVTVLATSGEQVLVIQDRGKIILVNSGDENTVKFTILPFLQQHGVNQINVAIAANSHLGLSKGWSKLLERLPIQTFYDNPAPQPNYYTTNQPFLSAIQARKGVYLPWQVNYEINLESAQLQLIDAAAPAIQLIISGKSWLLIGNIEPEAQKRLVATGNLSDIDILWWSGDTLTTELLQSIKPEVAIASTKTIDPETAGKLSQSGIQTFWTGRDGALIWTPAEGFKTTLDSDGADKSLL
ncbi:competence protein [Oscillatoriales cyanobacterium USR001]|nr:competence protein [Oscillatoriales cyanobacterium USR001]